MSSRGSPTLWSTYHDLKAVLDAPLIEKRVVATIYDDSKRIVNMTEIFPSLFIGDELMPNLIFFSLYLVLLQASNNFFMLQGSCQKHLLPKEDRRDSRPQHSRGDQGRPRGHEPELLQALRYPVQGPEAFGRRADEHCHVFCGSRGIHRRGPQIRRYLQSWQSCFSVTSIKPRLRAIKMQQRCS